MTINIQSKPTPVQWVEEATVEVVIGGEAGERIRRQEMKTLKWILIIGGGILLFYFGRGFVKGLTSGA